MTQKPTAGQMEAMKITEQLSRALYENNVYMKLIEEDDEGHCFKIEFLDRTTHKHLGEMATMTLRMLGYQTITELAMVGEFDGLHVENYDK